MHQFFLLIWKFFCKIGDNKEFSDFKKNLYPFCIMFFIQKLNQDDFVQGMADMEQDFFIWKKENEASLDSFS